MGPTDDEVSNAVDDLAPTATFTAIHARLRRAHPRLHFRAVDRALQRLRRAGRLTYDRHDHWRTTKDKP